MNRPRTALLVLIALSLIAFAGCGSSGDSTSASDATDTTEAVESDTTDTTSTDTTPSGDASALRESFRAGLKSSLDGKGLPADYTDCVLQKSDDSVSDDQIESLGKQVESGDSSAAEAIGVDLGKQCVAEGAGIDEFRAQLTGSIRTSLEGSDLSAAYQDCVVKESGKQISDDELADILLTAVENPSAAQKKSVAIGKQLGQECINQGVQP